LATRETILSTHEIESIFSKSLDNSVDHNARRRISFVQRKSTKKGKWGVVFTYPSMWAERKVARIRKKSSRMLI